MQEPWELNLDGQTERICSLGEPYVALQKNGAVAYTSQKARFAVGPLKNLG